MGVLGRFAVRIDVVFDAVCPWCYIGKHRLQRALAMRPDIAAEIRWRPFLLNPELPAGGIDRQSYLERKFGSNYRIQRIQAAAQQAGQSEGISFNFDAIARMPNSMNAHRLVNYAEASGQQGAVVEALFRAYFVESRDIGDIGILAEIAENQGFDRREAEAYLRGNGGLLAVETDNARMHRLGVSGVPCYIFDERYAIAGAQEAEIIARLLDIAGENEMETSSL
jgi:predicted DsbA family dithiol-disulfide isomerase